MMDAQIQVEGVESIRKRLGNLEHKAPTVLERAINRATTNIKANMAKQTSDRYNIKSTDVRKTIKVDKATKTKLNGLVISKSSPIALAKFKVSPNSPVTYSNGKASPKVYRAAVEKGRATDPLNGNPKSFIAVMKNGHKGVFVRTGRSDGLTRNERTSKKYNLGSRANRNSSHNEKIRQNFGPSVPQMIKNVESMKYIHEGAKSTLEKRIDAEVQNILRKGAAT